MQGNEDSNYDTFAGTPRDLWPNTTFEFWYDRSRTTANAADAGDDILGWSWNTTGRLITLGLESNPRRRQIYPSLLISREEPAPLHHLRYQDRDIFGDDQPHGAAKNYLEGDPLLSWNDEPVLSWNDEPVEMVADSVKGLLGSPGHRETMLSPEYRKVNIGLAWDRNVFKVVQHFEGDYVELDTLPVIEDGILELAGTLTAGHAFTGQIPLIALIVYDPAPRRLSAGQLARTYCYG